METPNSDIIRHKIGTKKFELLVEDKSEEFKNLKQKDKHEMYLDYGITFVSMGVTAGLIRLFTQNQINAIDAVKAESVLFALGVLGKYNIYRDRKYYYEQMMAIIDDIKQIIPEDMKLMTQEVLHEQGVDESGVPPNPNVQKKITYTEEGVKILLQKLMYIASMFS